MQNTSTHLKPKVAFIQGRPSAHPMHTKFAESVNSEFHYVDFKMRWQDRNKSILYRIISSVYCAFTFPNRRSYTIFFIDNLHFMPVLMKMLFLNRRKQKIVAHLGSHTLYFIYSHRFSKLNEYLHIQALKRYDALICEGKMAETLVRKILGDKTPKIYTVINGIPNEHFPENHSTQKTNSLKNILFVGHGPGKDRLWYKGLDIMLEAFHLARQSDNTLSFTIVGNWDSELILELKKPFDEETRKAIHFKGAAPDLRPYFSECSLYLHCARGEAYGLTILIAMAYGIVPIISDWTGAKEIVEQIDSRLIVPLTKEKISEKILWFMSLDPKYKIQISEKAKKTVSDYTEERAIAEFKKTFELMYKEFELP